MFSFSATTAALSSAPALVAGRCAAVRLLCGGGAISGRMLSTTSFGSPSRALCSLLARMRPGGIPRASQAPQARRFSTLAGRKSIFNGVRPKGNLAGYRIFSYGRRGARLADGAVVTNTVAGFEAFNRERVLYFFGKRIKFGWSEAAGHGSFLALAVSFLFDDILYLRMTACLAGVFMMIFNYFHPHGRPLFLPLRWNALFVVINAVWVGVLLKQSYDAANLTEEEVDLHDTIFAGHLRTREFVKLVRAGTWVQHEKGDMLTEEGTHNNKVHVLSSGRAVVKVGNRVVYELEPGQFVGEMGLHCGLRVTTPLQSTASVECTEPCRTLTWTRGALIDLLEVNPDIAAAVQAAISSDLVRKALDRDSVDSLLREKAVKNFMTFKEPKHGKKKAPTPPPLKADPKNLSAEERQLYEARRQASIQKRWIEKDHDMYFALMRGVMEDGLITRHERSTLKRYRKIHFISEEVHNRAISLLGWTQEQFEKGVNEAVKKKYRREQQEEIRKRGGAISIFADLYPSDDIDEDSPTFTSF